MAASVSKVDTFLSLRDGFERFASKTDEIVRVLELELRRLLEEWDERVQKAQALERERQRDLSDAQRDLRWCEERADNENAPGCSYEQTRVEKAKRSLAQAQTQLQFVSRSARELQMTCEAFQKHGRALRMMATQTAPNASSHMNILLRDIERNSFMAPAKDNGRLPTGHAASNVPSPGTSLREEASSPGGESDATYQIRRSCALRELAALLRGRGAPPSPRDAAHIALAAQKLRALPELAPAVWEHLLEPQRAEVLCSVERAMAQLQGRPPLAVVVEGDDVNINIYGGYDPSSNRIFFSRHFVVRASPREIIGAVVHEGRHAYQAHAMRHQGFHPDQNEVGRWRINHLYYLRADIWGDEAYRNQPVERDAFAYTEAVMRHMQGDAQ